jgi:transcriptional regulator with XRE-family HTH domain
MATMGSTKTQDSQELAGNLLRLARVKTGLTQRQLAEAAGVPQSTVARIETHRQQPTLPLLARLLAAADLELRTTLDRYDSHDDVLDTRRSQTPAATRRKVREAQDRFAAAGKAS